MIVSASRRCDLPAFYAPWFLNRIREGWALVQNPYNAGACSRVALTPDVVDCIVFWSKNPAPLLPLLGELDARGYAYYFQFTLTPYGPDAEPGLPPKGTLLETFRALSARLGPRRVVWRCDPLAVGERYPVEWQLRAFERMGAQLEGAARRCVISFLDEYPSIRKGLMRAGLRPPNREERLLLARGFAETAAAHGLELVTCCEEEGLSAFGIRRGACVDRELIESLLGCRLRAGRDRGQRGACLCAESVDIGAYGRCPHGCVYCYANAGRARAAGGSQLSPLLGGDPRPGAVVTERPARSLREQQTTLF